MHLPFVREVFADVEREPAFARLLSHLKSSRGEEKVDAGRSRVSGLTPTAQSLILSLLRGALKPPLLVLTAGNREAERMLPVLRSFCELAASADPACIIALPAYEALPFENLSPHPEIQETRAAALYKIASGAARIVIAPVEAAAMRLRPAEFYAGLARVLRHGESLEVEKLVEHLNTVGYSVSDVVEMPGQYALRGGILDVYPPEAERPARIEFFGDEIESIRSFDPQSQRSQQPREELTLLPLTETPVTQETLAAIHVRLSGRRVAGSSATVRQAVAEGGVTIFPGWEFFAPVAESPAALFDLLPQALVVVDEPESSHRALDAWWEKVQTTHQASNIGKLIAPEDLYLQPEELWARIERCPGAALEQLGITREAVTPETAEEEIAFAAQPTTRFHGNMALMAQEAAKLLAENRQVIFALPHFGEVERLAAILGEYNIPYRIGSRARHGGGSYSDESAQYFAEGQSGAALLVKAYLPQGVALPASNLVLYGGLDLFDESETVAAGPQRPRSKTAAFLSDFRDLMVGDYVVHVEHGIGRYLGLKQIALGEGETPQEFMALEFAESARLYVPLTRLDLVQKYRSSEGVQPALSRLGSAAWGKTKARVKKAMQDMADELLKLYAARKTAHSIAFSADGEWQREFDDAFEYSETDDQMEAIQDVKRDMESAQPMDRLLCGDVGYGKTEVAMRAAFKAVADHKQVAVLAPTTVLAFQHFETFKQRFAAFPITIEMLSRFRTAKQQKEILQKVETGKVDILIGTHRLLSKDLKFSDLGLLVVDEEQRFGVRHKERLKQMKKEVDVLTLSATPIPRTLHMSMVGLRDMSLIETPPKDRLAIQTVVAAYDQKLIKSAIEHELERGGQVYFVHNRVDSIYEIAAKIQELIPSARVLVGHGQLPEGELEKIMLKFIRHEADVLVATTIIENGLDIPLCNTMIVNRADRHGLSELYQLRGRVGRSNRRAYAYLLIPAEAELTPLARRRLAALKEFSELGAGFKIAALDLELRGAGNLLGGQQSGHIEAVGFEMYTSMLEQAVREMKGEATGTPAQAEAQLNLGLNIHIPGEYIAQENQRLRMYKRVAGAADESQISAIAEEIADRYGALPAALQNLLQYASLRMLCKKLGVSAIERKREQVSLRFAQDAAVDPARLAEFVARQRGAQFTPAGVLKFSMPTTQPGEVLEQLKSVLQELAAQEARVA